MSEINTNASDTLPAYRNQDPQDPLLSSIAEPQPFFQKHKKVLLVSFFIFVLLSLALGLGFGLGLKKNDDNDEQNNPDLIFSRNFQLFESFSYVRKSYSCLERYDPFNLHSKTCQNTHSNSSFHVVNIQDFQDDKNLVVLYEGEEQKKTKVYEVIIHLHNLTFSNETNSFLVGGGNFSLGNGSNVTMFGEDINFSQFSNEFIASDANSQRRFLQNNPSSPSFNNTSSNWTESFPMLRMKIFENGSIYKMEVPPKIKEHEMLHLIQLAKEFSPTIASRAYSNSSSFLLIDEPYNEYVGNCKIEPNLTYDKKNNENITLKRRFDGKNFRNIQLPESSLYSEEGESTFNKKKHLTSVGRNISSFFEHNDDGKDAGQSQKDEDYFDEDKTLDPRNLTNENYFIDKNKQSFNVTTSERLELENHQPENKNDTLVLLSFAERINFTTIDLTPSIGNETQTKHYQKMLSDKNKMMKRNLLELKLGSTPSQFKDNIPRIVYPVYQKSFYGWVFALYIIVEVKTDSDLVIFEVVLNVNGVMSGPLYSEEKKVDGLANALEKGVEFLEKALQALDKLIQDIEPIFKLDLGGELDKIFSKIEESVRFPFDILSIFKKTFQELTDTLSQHLNTFFFDVKQALPDTHIIFRNPFENYTTDFSNHIFDGITNFTKARVDKLNGLYASSNNSLSLISSLVDNLTEVYPDLEDDLVYISSLISNKFFDEVEKLQSQIENDLEDGINSIISSSETKMKSSFDTVQSFFSKSGFSSGLTDSINFFSQHSNQNIESLINWGDHLHQSFLNTIEENKEKIFAELNNTSKTLIANLKSQTDVIVQKIKSKVLNFHGLDKYENAFSKFWETLKSIENIKVDEINFLNNDFNDYLNSFYKDFYGIESGVNDYVLSFNKLRDEILMNATNFIRNYNNTLGKKILSGEIEGFLSDFMIQFSYEFSRKTNELLNSSLINNYKEEFILIKNISQLDYERTGKKNLVCKEKKAKLLSLVDEIKNVTKRVYNEFTEDIQKMLLDFSGSMNSNIHLTECDNSIVKYKALNGLDLDLLQNDIFECPLLLNVKTIGDQIGSMIDRIEKNILNYNSKIIDPIFLNFQLEFELLIDEFSNEITNNSAIEVDCQTSFNDCFILKLNNITSENLHNYSIINATCLYNDKFQSITLDFLNNYNESSHLKDQIAANISHIKIFFDAQLKVIEYSAEKLNCAINEIITTESSFFKPESFNALFDKLLEIEHNTINDYFFNGKVNSLGNKISESFTSSSGTLIQNLAGFVDNIDYFIRQTYNETFRIPDFLLNEVFSLLNQLTAKQNIYLQYYKQKTFDAFTSSLDKILVLHENNNKILISKFENLDIPFIVKNDYQNVLNKLKLGLISIQSNSSVIKENIIKSIDYIMMISFDNFKINFQSIIDKCNGLFDYSKGLIENIMSNKTFLYEFNSFETIKSFKEIFNVVSNTYEGISNDFVEKNEGIIENWIDTHLQSISTNFLSIFNQFENRKSILNQSFIKNFESKLQENSEVLLMFLDMDSSIIEQIDQFAINFNNSVFNISMIFKENLTREMNNFTIYLKNETKRLLDKYEDAVSDKIITQYNFFKSNILDRLTNNFNNIFDKLHSEFYDTLTALRIFVKNKYGLILDEILEHLQLNLKLYSFNGQIIDFKNYFDQYKAQLKDSIDAKIENVLKQAYDDGDVYINYIISMIQNLDVNLNDQILKEFVKISQTLEISNSQYKIKQLSMNNSDFQTFTNNSEVDFSINFFSFLKNMTRDFNQIFINNNLLNHTFSFNISSQIEFNLVEKFLNHTFLALGERLFNDVVEYHNNGLKVNVTSVSNRLKNLILKELDKTMDPIFSSTLDAGFILDFQKRMNNSFIANKDFISKKFEIISIYLTNLTFETNFSSFHAIVLLGLNKKLTVDLIQDLIKNKFEDWENLVEMQIIKILQQYEKSFIEKIAGISFDFIENELEREAFKNIINEMIGNSIINDTITNRTLNFSSSIKQFSISQLINPSLLDLNIKLEIIDKDLQNLEDGFKKIADLTNITEKNKIYSEIIKDIDIINNFAIDSFTFCQTIFDDLRNLEEAFKIEVRKLVDIFFGFLDPLSTKIDELINDLENKITLDNITPIIDRIIFDPIVGIHDKIYGYCEEIFDKITDKIIDVINNIDSNPSNANNSLKVYRNLGETFEIKNLQEAFQLFNNILTNSIHFIRNLPVVTKIYDTYENFKKLFSLNIADIISSMGSDLVIFIKEIDQEMINRIKNMISSKIINVQNFVFNQFNTFKNIITKAKSILSSFSFENLYEFLSKTLLNERDKILAVVFSKLGTFSYTANPVDINQRLPLFAIIIPIGPIPLKFEFDFEYDVFVRFSTHMSLFERELSITLQIGGSTSVEASAGICTGILDIIGFIRGTMAKVSGDMSLIYNFFTFVGQFKLCFSGTFGEVSVGVSLRSWISLAKLVCWLEKVVRSVCHICFLDWLCDLVFDIIQVCKWVSYFDWSNWGDVFSYKIFTAASFMTCPVVKELS